MQLEPKPNSPHACVVAVDALMAELGVTLYDLEILHHVRTILDEDGEAPYEVDELQAFTLACETVDHSRLANELLYVYDQQHDAVYDALEAHHQDSQLTAFRKAAQAEHDAYREQYQVENEEPPPTDQAFEAGALWAREHECPGKC